MENKTNKLEICVVGLGYVGLPLACLFAERYKVVGFDTNKERVAKLKLGKDDSDEVDEYKLCNALSRNLTLTSDKADIANCNFYVVAVPTPVDGDNTPDLKPIEGASKTVGSVLRRGDIVVYESTVWPGLTEDICVPILEKESGLKFNEDFWVGFSPERVNPSDKTHTVDKICKITSGSTPESAAIIDAVYRSVLKNGTHKASSIKVAEAAKIIENAQRDVNIAFINEVKRIMDGLGVDVMDVIEAAATKWNFLPFRPGLVGGHCIGVDPYYLIKCAEDHGVDAALMKTARQTNEGMSRYVAESISDQMEDRDIKPGEGKILLLGISFKPDCPDIRNTKVADLYRYLSEKWDVTVLDPRVDPVEVMAEYGIEVKSKLADIAGCKYDAIVKGAAHKEFESVDFAKYLTPEGFTYALGRRF